jgi:diaminopimelate epimerase
MRIEFTKMHGSGNDFIVLEATAGAAVASPELIRRMADRHTGIGFDQALVLEQPRRPDTIAFYRIFNADGTEVEQCGNGARCLAALLAGRARTAPQELTLDSNGGVVHARILAPQLIAVDMGIPSFEPSSLPFDAAAGANLYRMDVAGENVEFGAVSIGNPHAVITVSSVEAACVERMGSPIEHHRRFPERVNVGFMQIVDRTHIRLRVHERGAGETLACGTGACAAVAVGRQHESLDAEVQVSMRGGELRVNWRGPGEHIWLTGPAEVSFMGYFEV